MELASKHCVPCRGDAPRVPAAEVPRLLREIPDWAIVEHDGGPRLRRTFSFPDFARAMAFTLQIGTLAEREDHHPTLLLRWGKVTVTWWTHAIQGLHENDFIMAARCDAIYGDVGETVDSAEAEV